MKASAASRRTRRSAWTWPLASSSRARGRRPGRQPRDVVGEQPLQEPGGVRPLDPDQRRPARGRPRPARPAAGGRSRRPRRGAEGRRRHGVATLPLELARSAATRACCSSWSTGREDLLHHREPAGLVAALEQLLLGPRRQLEGPRDGVRERDALRRRGHRVVGQAGEGAEAGEHPVGQLGLRLARARRPAAGPGPRSRGAPRTPRPARRARRPGRSRSGARPRTGAPASRTARSSRCRPVPVGPGLDDHERPVLEHAVGVELAVARLEEVERAPSRRGG